MPKQRPLWPSWRYGPDGQKAIFLREEDVPDGWQDHPAAQFEPPAPPAAPPLERWEVVAQLKAKGVAFKRNAPTSVLYDQLKALDDGDMQRDHPGSVA